MAGEKPTIQANKMTEIAKRGLTDSIWVLLNECWEINPANRPNSTQICERLFTMRPEDKRLPSTWNVGQQVQTPIYPEALITPERLHALISGDGL